MKVISGKPLPLSDLITITKLKAVHIGGYKCRVMNFSDGQEVEVVDVVEAHGHKWGIKKCIEPKKDYDNLAFIVQEVLEDE